MISASSGRGRNGRRRLAGLLAAFVVLLADQASKFWVLDVRRMVEGDSIAVLPFLNITLVRNQGVTFGLLHGLGSGARLILAGVALAVVAALAVWIWRAQRLLVALALGAIAGGAVGNVLDRARFGRVTDFIHAHVGVWSWYVFNIGDAAIVCGVAALLLDGFRSGGGRTGGHHTGDRGDGGGALAPGRVRR